MATARLATRPDQVDLLPRIANGDADAVTECLERYGRLIASMARRTLANPSDAEDAAQDAFIKLWRSAGRYDARIASERTFVTMLTRRCLIDHQRRRGRLPGEEPLVDGALVSTDAPSSELETLEERDRMLESLR